MAPRKAFDFLNRITGLAPMTAPDFEGADPIIPTPFHVADAATASLGFSAAVAAEIWRLRGGEKQAISIDLKAAAALADCHFHVRQARRRGFRAPGARCADG